MERWLPEQDRLNIALSNAAPAVFQTTAWVPDPKCLRAIHQLSYEAERSLRAMIFTLGVHYLGSNTQATTIVEHYFKSFSSQRKKLPKGQRTVAHYLKRALEKLAKLVATNAIEKLKGTDRHVVNNEEIISTICNFLALEL